MGNAITIDRTLVYQVLRGVGMVGKMLTYVALTTSAVASADRRRYRRREGERTALAERMEDNVDRAVKRFANDASLRPTWKERFDMGKSTKQEETDN